MPVDSRDDLDRLSRIQLYREADAQGITYPPDHPGEGMRALLRANGVSRGTMKTVKWRSVHPSEQEIQAAQHQGTATSVQYYPEREVHQSARAGVDSSAILQNKLAEAESKNDEQESEIEQLRAEIAKRDDALARVEALLEKLTTTEKEPDKEPDRQQNPKAGQYWTLYREVKALGLPVFRGISAEALQELLDGHENPVERSQRPPEENRVD